LGLDPFGGTLSFHTSAVEKRLFDEGMLDDTTILDSNSTALDTLRASHVVNDDDLDWD
jgi:hypothetical protein